MTSLLRTATAAVSAAATYYATDVLVKGLEVAMRDPAVGKLVGGSLYTVGGVFLIAKSSIWSIFCNSFSKSEQAPKLTTTRTIAAAAGGTMLGVGLCSLIMGAHELYERLYGCPKAQFPNADYFPDSSPQNCALLDGVVTKLKGCRESAELLAEMRAKRGITFDVRSMSAMSNAQLDTGTDTILFRRSALEAGSGFDLGTEMLCKSKYVVEKAIRLQRQTRCGRVNFDQYVEGVGEHEYVSFSCKDAVLGDCRGDFDRNAFANSTAVCPTFAAKFGRSICNMVSAPKLEAIYTEWLTIVWGSRWCPTK